MWILGLLFFPQIPNSVGSRHTVSASCAVQTVFNQIASWSRQVETQIHCLKTVSIFTYLALQVLCLFQPGYRITSIALMVRIGVYNPQQTSVLVFHYSRKCLLLFHSPLTLSCLSPNVKAEREKENIISPMPDNIFCVSGICVLKNSA